jgi:hypothetical protein
MRSTDRRFNARKREQTRESARAAEPLASKRLKELIERRELSSLSRRAAELAARAGPAS